MTHSAKYRIITILVISAVIAFILLTMPSCYTARTAERQVDKAHHRYPLVPAKYCADHFDPTDSASTIVEYLQGDTLVFTDTLIQSVTDTIDATVYVYKTIVNTRTVHDTVKTKEYVKTENKAKIVVLEAEKGKLQTANAELSTTLGIRTKWLWILGGLICAFLVYKVASRFIKGKA